MVKFAEAEKRGRGGEGVDRRLAPQVMLERPKRSRATWESVKSHIIKERKRKKEEQEADAEEKRLRKEREVRKKQHAMTLEETREKLSQMEQDLNNLKSQKHQLFQELKVVLNEDATRKKAQQQQNNYHKENEMIVHPYSHGSIPISGHPQMLYPSNIVPGRSLPIHGYKVPPSQPQPLLTQSTIKRTRSPTPPPQQPTYPPYNFKNLPAHPPPSNPVTIPTTKAGIASSVYVTGQAPYYHGTSQPHGSSSQPAAYLPPAAPTHTNPPAPPTQPQPPPPAREDKRISSVYMQSSRATHAPPTLHQPLDHKGKPAASSFLPPGEGVQEKYYGSGVRSHLTIHSGVLPVQQQHPGPASRELIYKGNKGGSITSGFPVRTAPPPSSQPPPPVVCSGSHVSKPDVKPRAYTTQPGNYTGSFY